MTLKLPLLYIVCTEEYCQTSPNKNKSPNLWHITSPHLSLLYFCLQPSRSNMDLRTQSDIMGNLRVKGLAIMSLNVTPSIKSKDWARWSVVLAYSGKKRVKVLDFRHPKGSWFPTDVATTLLQRHEISHKCKVAPFCTTQKRTLLHCTKMCFYYISSNENLLTILINIHSHDLTRTCFPGMYWVLPWECSCPDGGIIRSEIYIWSDCIGQNRDNSQLGTLSTILQHFTHIMKPSDPLLLADVTLRCRQSWHLLTPSHPLVLPEWPYTGPLCSEA